MPTPTRASRDAASTRPELVRRLLHSESFARSRHLAERLDSDPVMLAELLDLVRLRLVRIRADEHLAHLATLIADAVAWLDGIAFDGGASAAAVARRRMAVAALSYLVDFNDVIPDDAPGGTVDDQVVLEVVLSRALDRG
ncbi:hypothetical protein [Knoellia subterranea]|uniref:Uncharacterized protein n=1 Tax=Knoellia subterranea KCTC 19937 TaxID=1385521 RepID=A0A0A0JNU4_9MICO|nr:hypothetical protein [Knoellia subterranea]KGN37291.1 hypothetical protein N803_15000 [Knoellia subterranea KCTC 19937]